MVSTSTKPGLVRMNRLEGVMTRPLWQEKTMVDIAIAGIVTTHARYMQG